MVTLSTNLLATSYFVATSGNDNNAGTIDSPFATVTMALSVMKSGDICYIREGSYHEEVTISNMSDITIQAYSGEHVLFDGTYEISSDWTEHEGSIYKTTLSEDIWQLFVDRSEVVMARWPNARFDDFSVFDNDNHWAHGDHNNSSITLQIDAPYTNNEGELISLEASGIDATGAVAILNNSSFQTWARKVLTHSGSSFTFNATPANAFRTKHHYYFLEGKLELLDAENEWFYNPATKELYLWAPNNQHPAEFEVRGKKQTYAFTLNNTENVEVKDIFFFSTTCQIRNSRYSGINNCHFLFPNNSKRMLGDLSYSPGTYVSSDCSYCYITKSYFAYTDGPGLVFYSDYGTVEDNYFYFIDYTCAEGDNLQPGINMNKCTEVLFKNNTAHKMGSSALLDPGSRATITYNDLYENGMIQSDGAMIQCMKKQQLNINISYNWLHDTEKYGARFDGGDYSPYEEGFRHGTMHHNVAWNVKSGFIAKGNLHDMFCNTAFDCDAGKNKSDIAILYGAKFGPNDSTNTINNAAGTISGERNISTTTPIPGNYTNNWNGLETGENIKELLTSVPTYTDVNDYDPTKLDFRPKQGTALVDGGIEYSGRWIEASTNGFVGDAPDIGAYEYGGENWRPGITWDVDSLETVFYNEVLGNSPDTNTYCNVTFIVKDGEEFLQDAQVQFNEVSKTTTENGEVQFDSILHGKDYLVYVNLTGYEEYLESYSINSDTSFTVQLSGITNLSDIFKSSWQIVPNPAKDIIHIEFSEDFTEPNIEVSIFDVYGRCVYQEVTGEWNNLSIDMGSKGPGTYVVFLKTKEQIASKRIIVY